MAIPAAGATRAPGGDTGATIGGATVSNQFHSLPGRWQRAVSGRVLAYHQGHELDEYSRGVPLIIDFRGSGGIGIGAILAGIYQPVDHEPMVIRTPGTWYYNLILSSSMTATEIDEFDVEQTYYVPITAHVPALGLHLELAKYGPFFRPRAFMTGSFTVTRPVDLSPTWSTPDTPLDGSASIEFFVWQL